MEKNDFAIVGCGYWGKNIVRVFSELLKNEIFNGNIYLYDKNAELTENLAKSYNFYVANSFEDILKNPNISSVLIITPSSSHYDLAKSCLLANKNVFVEKPFALNSKNALELVQLSEKKNLILMVGHLFRYHQGILNLKQRIDLGEFGDILYLFGYKFGYSVPNEDAGVILTLGVNDVDTMCFLTGYDYPESISAQKGIFLHHKNEEFATVSMKFKEGLQAHFINTWLMPIFERMRELVVVGSKKTAKINYLKPNELTLYNVRIQKEEVDSNFLYKMIKKESQVVNFEFKEPLYEEMAHFVDCIINYKKPKSDGYVAYRAIKMCEIALKSADFEKTLKITDEIQ